MHKICAMTGTRADWGLLKRTLRLLDDNPDIELTIAVCGTHLLNEYGYTVQEIIGDGFTGYDKVEFPMCENGSIAMAESVSCAIKAFFAYFEETGPDVFMVLGDRYEAFAAASAAFMSGIPIVHISGGDITEGALDDTFRHCITKMSFLHFTGCEQSRQRVLRMGETHVYNVGEPGVENALKNPLLNRQELADATGFSGFLKDYALVTFHPVTLEGGAETALAQVRELMDAIEERDELNYVVTLANADAGGDLINEAWAKFNENHDNVFVISSLGATKYLSAMKYCKMVLGNSSSGIVEAPSFAVPTVNIGNRQKGRMMAKSVVCCDMLKEDIVKSMDKVREEDFCRFTADVKSPFGDGRTSELIVKILLDYLAAGNIRQKADFNDNSGED